MKRWAAVSVGSKVDCTPRQFMRLLQDLFDKLNELMDHSDLGGHIGNETCACPLEAAILERTCVWLLGGFLKIDEE